MAILSRKPTPAFDPVITPLADHPEHIRLSAIRRALLNAAADRQRELDLAAIEAELAKPTSGSARGPRAKTLRARAETLRKALPAPVVAQSEPDGLPPAVVAALALLQGEKVALQQDRGARLNQLRQELAIIEAASSGVSVLLDELKSEQTVEAATALSPKHRAALAEIYAAAAALAAAAQAEREIIVSLIGAGYDAAEHILQRPGLGAASRLGTLLEHDSEISFFKRRMQSLGVI